MMGLGEAVMVGLDSLLIGWRACLSSAALSQDQSNVAHSPPMPEPSRTAFLRRILSDCDHRVGGNRRKSPPKWGWHVRFRPEAGKLEAGQFVQTTLDTWQCSALLLPVRRLVPVELHRLNRIFMGDSMILEKNL